MKSIKILLNQSNNFKQLSLLSIFNELKSISKEYLLIRQNELETKAFWPFKEHYNYYRGKYPNLNSGIIQSHLRYQDSMLKSYITWCKKRHKLVSFPKDPIISIPLRNDMFHFEYSKTSKKFNAWLKFQKVYYPLNLCQYHIDALQTFDDISDSSIILDNKQRLCLRLVFKTKQISIAKLDTSKTIGIDLGIVKPIVCSDGKMFGNGKYIVHKKLMFSKQRAKHQKQKQQIIDKQSRWTADVNHKLSHQLVDYCQAQGIGVLGLEALRGSHLSNKKFRRYSWAFKDLLTKIIYKAELAGLKVISVDPKYTSQTCNICGQKDKTNRISQSRFHCCYCNQTANADINAAKNINSLLAVDRLNVNPTIE